MIFQITLQAKAKRSLWTLAVCLFWAATLHADTAAPDEATGLVEGLRYVRPPALDTATAALADPTPVIIDLRQVAATPDEASNLARALAPRPPTARVYLLVGAATPEPIAAVLHAVPPGVLVLGVKEAHPSPQVVIDQSPEDDARAVVAIAAGARLEDLISGKVEKPRFDEATLVREFKDGNHDAHPPEPGAEAKPVPAPLSDRVLQRAVQLHRALQALQR